MTKRSFLKLKVLGITRSIQSHPEPAILLSCARDRDLWPVPISEHARSIRSAIFSQSELLDLTMSLWIAEFRCWTRPEVSVPDEDQKNRGLWGRKCHNIEPNKEHAMRSTQTLLLDKSDYMIPRNWTLHYWTLVDTIWWKIGHSESPSDSKILPL